MSVGFGLFCLALNYKKTAENLNQVNRHKNFLIVETFGWTSYWQNFLIVDISKMSTIGKF